jgi:hypothetical protein
LRRFASSSPPLVFRAIALALILAPASAEAQIGRLRNMVAGVTKGEVYGMDVTEIGSPVVFVVDLTPVIELPPGAVENLRQMAAQQGEAYVRRKLAEEGSDWALRAAGPAGMVVKEVMSRRSDRAERARNHVRAAIEGLDEDQRFGLVTFEGGPQSWRSPAPLADEPIREEAREFLAGLQKVEGDGFLQSALMAAAGFAAGEAATGAFGGAPGSVADPAAMQAPVGSASDPQVQAAMMAAATVEASAPAPASPVGPTVSTESLLRGIELALELDPEAIVVVVGSTSAEDPELVAHVHELLGEREVTIYAAVFGEDQPGGVLQALAEANGGRLLTAEEEEEE